MTWWWFETYLGKTIQFDEYFSTGWFNHQLDDYLSLCHGGDRFPFFEVEVAVKNHQAALQLLGFDKPI